MARLVSGRWPRVLVLPVALALALPVERVDVVHPDVEDLLDGLAHVDLGGRRVDDEDVDVVVHQRVGLLRHHGPDEHVVGIPHDPLPSSPVVGRRSRRRGSIGARSASAVGSSGTGADRSDPPGRVSSVNTTQSLTRMS